MEISALLEWCETKKKRFKSLVLIRVYQALIEKQTLGIASAPHGLKSSALFSCQDTFGVCWGVLVLAFTRDTPFTVQLFNCFWLSERTPVLTLRVTCLQMSESRACQLPFGSNPAECSWKSQLPAWHSCSHVMFFPLQTNPRKLCSAVTMRSTWRMENGSARLQLPHLRASGQSNSCRTSTRAWPLRTPKRRGLRNRLTCGGT